MSIDEFHAVNGGRKRGVASRRPPEETRRLMLDVLGRLLETRSPWDIRAADVAAGSGTTQPNFYSHFRNIQEAIEARVALAWQHFPDDELSALVDQDWTTSRGAAAPYQIVQTSIAFWENHGGVLRIVHRLHPDDHPGLLALRHHAQKRFLASCEKRIRAAQAEGQVGATVDASLAANGAVVFLDNAASVYEPMRDKGGYAPDVIVQTIGAMFRVMLGGNY